MGVFKRGETSSDPHTQKSSNDAGNAVEENPRRSTSSSDDTQIVVDSKPPTATWKGYIWDTWDLPQDQRKLLFKVDAFVLTFASLGYFLKNLDETNVNNAFLSGMKEELNMYGNELVTSVSIWTTGYVVGQIPCNLLLTRVSPRWVIPTLELCWGVCTIVTSSVKSYKSLYVLRFFVGLLSIHYMLGSWYTPREIGKRAMIFWLSGTIGRMFSGILQAAAYTNLHGVHGRSGWRWLFVVDGIITIPLAIAGYIFFPNMPHSKTKTWWLSKEDISLAVARMKAVGRAGQEPWSKAKIRRIARSWKTWVMPFIYVAWNQGGPQQAMGYWLKSFNEKPYPMPGTHFTVPQINNLPLVSNAIFIVMSLIWAWVSDALGGVRWPFMYIGAVCNIIFCVTFIRMPLYSNIYGRKIVYWMSRIGAGSGPLVFSWINEVNSDDTEKRALLVAMGNDFAYVFEAIFPNFVWKTTEFPAAIKGYSYSIGMESLLILLTALTQFLLWRDRVKASKVVEPRVEEEGYEDLVVSDETKKQATETKVTPARSSSPA